MADQSLPTEREIGFYPQTERDPERRSINTIPWIDVHQHTQSLTWNERTAFDISGCHAAVMIAASYYWSPYRPVSPGDVRFLWDDALRRAKRFDAFHCYDQYVAIGVHTWSYVKDVGELLSVLPDYCELESVVAVGETGIDSSQHTISWDLAEQREVVGSHFRIAANADLPVLIHTPGGKDTVSRQYTEHYEEFDNDFSSPHFDPSTAKREAVEIDLELIEEVGIPESSVLIDHADETIVERVLETTDCYLGFSVGSPWFRGVGAELVSEVIDKYGADRIIVDTDLIDAMDHDPYTMKRTMLDLFRLGVSADDIRSVVYDNPRELLAIQQ